VPQVLAFPFRELFDAYFPAVGKPRRPLATLARAVGAIAYSSSSFLKSNHYNRLRLATGDWRLATGN
jgi:hypothetical protein